MTMYTLQQISLLLFYSNFAINFLLYCVTGQNFRRAVTTLFMPATTKKQLGVGLVKNATTRASVLTRSRLNASTRRGSLLQRQGSPLQVRLSNTGNKEQLDEHYV